ncbi:hypothetical protein DSM100688_0505 [Bifidobacterium ramosum]|uniref:Uncharacterized protein n=1 Tax=Bifidobacterium ramosum TaxID=1798158 RepID=A0A6L4X394_9BIFI|nr:hypothetical protein DSM100688_0505 [Bifidobacterium ramosum]
MADVTIPGPIVTMSGMCAADAAGDGAVPPSMAG